MEKVSTIPQRESKAELFEHNRITSCSKKPQQGAKYLWETAPAIGTLSSTNSASSPLGAEVCPGARIAEQAYCIKGPQSLAACYVSGRQDAWALGSPTCHRFRGMWSERYPKILHTGNSTLA